MQVAYLFACSGPGAGRAIAEAIQYGYLSAGITLAISLATALLYLLVRHSVRAAILNLSPMAIHPAWTISAVHGDCGCTKVMASDLWIGLATCLLIAALLIALRRGRARNTTLRFQYSIRSLLLLMLATAAALTLLRTDLAGYVSLLAFVSLILIALKPIHFFQSRWKNDVLIQQHIRERIQSCHDESDVTYNVDIDSRVADRFRH